MSVRGTSIAIMDKGASSRYKDASSSQEMQSDWKIRKLRAELEEAEQATNDDLANEAKDKKARDKEAAVKEAKDRGAGGATCEVEEEGGRRSNSSEENGDHPEEESDEGITGERGKISPAKRGKVAEQKRAFERKVERVLERRMNVLELGGQYHDRYGETSMHAQREAQSTMGEPSRGVVLDGSLGEPETVRPRVAASAKRTTGLPDSGSTRLGCRG